MRPRGIKRLTDSRCTTSALPLCSGQTHTEGCTGECERLIGNFPLCSQVLVPARRLKMQQGVGIGEKYFTGYSKSKCVKGQLWKDVF